MSVNVSARELMSAGFANVVAAALNGASSDARLLILEVSERAFLRDSERALIVLNHLKEIGVTLALDNFGTGVSSLSHVQRYPLDGVKLDRQVTAALHRDAATRAVMTAVTGLAHSLGMSVVSEGIETVEQGHHVTGLGCDSCQGFYFARPMPASSIARLIQAHPDKGAIRLPTPQMKDPAISLTVRSVTCIADQRCARSQRCRAVTRRNGSAAVMRLSRRPNHTVTRAPSKGLP
jgi:EAL domain-containing protein (putative c-di-GMP-specific phosphodiesterase class I)